MAISSSMPNNLNSKCRTDCKHMKDLSINTARPHGSDDEAEPAADVRGVVHLHPPSPDGSAKLQRNGCALKHVWPDLTLVLQRTYLWAGPIMPNNIVWSSNIKKHSFDTVGKYSFSRCFSHGRAPYKLVCIFTGSTMNIPTRSPW